MEGKTESDKKQKEAGKLVARETARDKGIPAGIIANNGEICALCASKAARFIHICDSFNNPVVTFADIAGFTISVQEDTGGHIRESPDCQTDTLPLPVPRLM